MQRVELWNFRAPKEIYGLKISNCGYLELDISCGGDDQPIHSVQISNIKILNITSKTHPELGKLPKIFILDKIDYIKSLPSHIFKQDIKFPEQLYNCYVGSTKIHTLFMSNIAQIDSIETNAIELSDMDWFLWYNVTVVEIQPFGVNLSMNRDRQITIKNSRLERIGYKAFVFKSHSVFINTTTLYEVEKFGFSGTVYWFDVTNCRVGTLHPSAFFLLAQHVNIFNNTFARLEPRAFHTIGPGLLENAQISFGKLRFTYVFSKNRIYQANFGSLNPDWEAYKNVRTYLNFTLNQLPCSCNDFGWLMMNTGMGPSFKDAVPFSKRVLDKESQNICVDAPCFMPVAVMALLNFQNGTCHDPANLREICARLVQTKDFQAIVNDHKMHMDLDQDREGMVENALPLFPFSFKINDRRVDEEMPVARYGRKVNPTDETEEILNALSNSTKEFLNNLSLPLLNTSQINLTKNQSIEEKIPADTQSTVNLPTETKNQTSNNNNNNKVLSFKKEPVNSFNINLIPSENKQSKTIPSKISTKPIRHFIIRTRTADAKPDGNLKSDARSSKILQGGDYKPVQVKWSLIPNTQTSRSVLFFPKIISNNNKTHSKLKNKTGKSRSKAKKIMNLNRIGESNRNHEHKLEDSDEFTGLEPYDEESWNPNIRETYLDKFSAYN